MSVTLNGSYVLDALKALKGEQTEFAFSLDMNDFSACLHGITGSDFPSASVILLAVHRFVLLTKGKTIIQNDREFHILCFFLCWIAIILVYSYCSPDLYPYSLFTAVQLDEMHIVVFHEVGTVNCPEKFLCINCQSAYKFCRNDPVHRREGSIQKP